jgi:hypothetical protein
MSMKHGKEIDDSQEVLSGSANLPLDEKVLNRALMLLNLTMSEQLIKKWIQEVKPYLECKQLDR